MYAVEMLKCTKKDVARTIGLSTQTVTNWVRWYKKGRTPEGPFGIAALRRNDPDPRSKYKITSEQRNYIVELVYAGPPRTFPI